MRTKEIFCRWSTWIAIIVSIIMILAVNHNDCIVIVNWVLSYLDHIFSFNINNYAIDYVNSGGFFTNYSLFSISVISVWILPIYLISKWISIPLVVYTTCMKILMAILAFVLVGLIEKICKKLNLEVDYCKVEILFILSPIVALYSIGMGQIDGIAVVLMLCGILLFLNGSYLKMSIVLGLSLLIKGFSIFAIAVILVYLIRKNIKNIVYAIPIGLILVVEKVLSEIIVKDFLSVGSVINKASFLPRVFEVEWNMFSPCIGLIALVLFYVYFKSNEEDEVFCMNFCMMIYMCFFMFFDWSPQYLYYMLPFMIIVYLQIREEMMNRWIWWGSNVALLIFGILHFNYDYINGLLFSESVIGKCLGWKDIFLSNVFDVGTYHYFGIVAKTLWVVCTIVMIMQVVLKGRNKNV